MRRIGLWAVLVATALVAALVIRARGEECDVIADIRPSIVATLLALKVVNLVPQTAHFAVVSIRFIERLLWFCSWTPLFVVERFLHLFIPRAGHVYRAVEL